MKKTILFFLLIIAAFAFVTYRELKKELKTNLALNAKVAAITDKIDIVKENAAESIKRIEKESKNIVKESVKALETANPLKAKSSPQTSKTVEMRLKHGGVIKGRLIEKTDKDYTVMWNDQKFVIDASRIKSIDYKDPRDIDWPYKNNVVIKRTNGIIVDGEISNVSKDKVTAAFREGGGLAEIGIDKKDIEYLIFAPAYNDETYQTEDHLREQYPKMKVYKEGNVVIFTDSHPKWVEKYRKTIRGLYTEIYLEFFNLFKERSPKTQNFVVIFDNYADYAESAITDGVPFWAAVGYFNQISKTLYIFNAFGEKMEKVVFEVIIGKSGELVDKVSSEVEKYIDQRYKIFLDGQLKELRDRYWDAYYIYKDELSSMTIETLRHEFAHEVFHNWGLQSIIVSKSNVDKDELSKRKKEFLETKDYNKKEQLLTSLIKLKKEEVENIQVEASQSWLAEGIATYCETEPIGGLNESWLYVFQEMVRKNELNPVESLMAYKMGSFPGMCTKGMLNSYAHGWALATFLMKKYPVQFMEFQRRMAERKIKKGKDEEDLLLASLGKDLPTLEKEFQEFMNSYEQLEDPYVKRYMRFYNIWDKLVHTDR